MKIRLNYIIDNKKFYAIGEMKKVPSSSSCYYDFYCHVKRDDRVNEYLVTIIDDCDKVIHKEIIHINWITNPNDTVWTYGITLCGERVVSEMRYGSHFPVCLNIYNYKYIHIRDEKTGELLYNKDGSPVIRKMPAGKSIKNIKCGNSKILKQFAGKLKI